MIQAKVLLPAGWICLSGTVSLAQSSTASTVPEFIGSAQMLPDGTIYADLIAVTPDGKSVGHRRFIVGPADPNYEAFRVHVGGLNPGDDKPIPPYPPLVGEGAD